MFWVDEPFCEAEAVLGKGIVHGGEEGGGVGGDFLAGFVEGAAVEDVGFAAVGHVAHDHDFGAAALEGGFAFFEGGKFGEEGLGGFVGFAEEMLSGGGFGFVVPFGGWFFGHVAREFFMGVFVGLEFLEPRIVCILEFFLLFEGVELCPQGGDFLLEGSEFFEVGEAADFEHGIGVAAAAGAAAFGELVEEVEELVVFLLGDGVVLVVVAPSALPGEAHEDGGGGLSAVANVLDEPLGGVDAAFVVKAVVAVETGGELLPEGGVFELVPGELFDEELVVGHVVVEGFDDPVAPWPHVAEGVAFVAIAVGIAGGVEPAPGHVLAITGGVHEAVDGGGEVGGFEEGFVLGFGGGKAGEVEGDAAQEGAVVGGRGGLEGRGLEFAVDKAVNVAFCPICSRGEFGVLDGLEGPVACVVRAFGYPLSEELGFLLGYPLWGLLRRHAFLRVFVRDAVEEFAFSWFAGGDGLEGVFPEVKPQVALPGLGIRPVASEALVGKDGADVFVEVDFPVRRESQHQEGEEGQAAGGHISPWIGRRVARG